MALLVSFVSETAQANPVDASFTVSGSPGNWLVDLSLTNNLGGTNIIYFVGIQLPSTNEISAPAGWYYNPGDNPWTYTPSGTVFNNPWCGLGCFDAATAILVGIKPGQTLGGFEALDTSLTQPTNLPWFAYSWSGTFDGPGYEGPGCFNCGNNPDLKAQHSLPEPRFRRTPAVRYRLRRVGFVRLAQEAQGSSSTHHVTNDRRPE